MSVETGIKGRCRELDDMSGLAAAAFFTPAQRERIPATFMAKDSGLC